MAIKVIITGATGMVGEGVLLECLQNEKVSEVLIVNRKHYDLAHPKLKELLIPDFKKAGAFSEALKGYEGCFYCAGVTSIGKNEKEYTEITYDTTLAFAKVLAELNPGMVFNFVTGTHTDSSEQGKIMWARVKGKTENGLMRLPFKNQFNFRPGFMKPVEGQKNINTLIKVFGFVYMNLFPARSLTLHEVGNAMINAVLRGYPKQVLEISDIKELARNK